MKILMKQGIENSIFKIGKLSPLNLKLGICRIGKTSIEKMFGWEDVVWEFVGWEDVVWEFVGWEDVVWEFVGWENVHWENIRLGKYLVGKMSG